MSSRATNVRHVRGQLNGKRDEYDERNNNKKEIGTLVHVLFLKF